MIISNQETSGRYLISDQSNFMGIRAKDTSATQNSPPKLTPQTLNSNLDEMHKFFKKDGPGFTDLTSEKEKISLPQSEISPPVSNQSGDNSVAASEMTLATSAAAGAMPSPQGQALKTIDILYTNDLHGTITPEDNKGEPRGGLAYVGSVIRDLKNKSDGNSILLDGGDWSQGTYESRMTEGKTVIDFMNTMGYDAAEVGNHEFDWSKKDLQNMAKRAVFPVLGANIEKEKPGVLDEVKPYTIKEINGVKVGIVGLITPDTAKLTKSKNLEGLKFADQKETMEKYIPEMKEKGADLIVVLSHEGEDEDKKLAQSVRGIDVIVGGHSHTSIEKPDNVNGTLIVQSGSKGQNVGDLKLEIDPQTKKIVSFNNQLVPVNDKEIKPDPEVEKLIAPVLEDAKIKKAEVVGTTSVDLTHEGRQAKESIMGNIITDAMREKTGNDIGMLNSAGIRGEIKKGEINFGELHDALPFENSIVSMNLTGKQVKEIMEDSARRKGNRIQVSGMSMDIDQSKPEGQRVSNIKVQGMPLDLEHVYSVAADEFLSGGGDNYGTFKEGKDVKQGELLLDSIKDYMKKHSPITSENAKIEGRLNFFN